MWKRPNTEKTNSHPQFSQCNCLDSHIKPCCLATPLCFIENGVELCLLAEQRVDGISVPIID